MIKADPQDKAAPSSWSRACPENAHLAIHVFLLGVLKVALKPL